MGLNDKRMAKAKAAFWAVIDSKIDTGSTVNTYQRLRDGIDYMLDNTPAWAIDRATKLMKMWKPSGI